MQYIRGQVSMMTIETFFQLPQGVNTPSKIIEYVNAKLQDTSLVNAKSAQVPSGIYTNLQWNDDDPIDLGDDVVSWCTKKIPSVDNFCCANTTAGTYRMSNLQGHDDEIPID